MTKSSKKEVPLVKISRENQFPANQDDYDTYCKIWQEFYDKEEALVTVQINNLKSSHKVLDQNKSYKKEVEKLQNEFIKKCAQFKNKLDEKFKDKVSLEIPVKDFDWVQFFKENPGQQVIGSEKDKDNILIVLRM